MPLKGELQTRSLRRSHSTNLLRKVIQQGVETFKAALVNGHPDTPKLAVATFVESDSLGRDGRGHMGVARIGGRGFREGRGMFRRGSGVP